MGSLAGREAVAHLDEAEGLEAQEALAPFDVEVPSVALAAVHVAAVGEPVLPGYHQP